MRKEQSHVMLELHNVRIDPSSVRKKGKRTTQCNKRTVICDVVTAQYEDGTVRCEEKKSKGTTTCEKKIVTCNIKTA